MNFAMGEPLQRRGCSEYMSIGTTGMHADGDEDGGTDFLNYLLARGRLQSFTRVFEAFSGRLGTATHEYQCGRSNIRTGIMVRPSA